MALIAHDLTFESGTIRQDATPPGAWSGIEQASTHQSAVVTNDGTAGRPPAHPGFTKSAYTEIHTGDLWANHSYRCLFLQVFSSGSDPRRPRNGDEGWWAMAMYIPTSPGLGSTQPLLWELHNTSQLQGSGGIVPFALHVGLPTERIVNDAYTAPTNTTTRGILFRCTAGEKTPTGWAYYHPNILIPGLQPVPPNVWLNFIIRIRMREANTGLFQIWLVQSNSPTAGDFVEASPTVSKTGAFTAQFDTETNIHNDPLYPELGLYQVSNPSSQVIVYHTGERIRLSFADAVAALVGSGGGGDTTAPLLQTASVNASTLVLTYSETLDTG
jgi:hypothetical protein